ncbi:MAG: thioesterase [Eubacteriales bacterium]
MEKYSQNFGVSFRDVDITGQLTINTLVDFMQEIARQHALKLGVDYSSYEDDYYWIVVRTKAKLDTAPKIGDNIRIETYIAGTERLFSVRRFDIYDEENQLLGYIIAYYLLMNKRNHRPVKLKSLEGNASMFQQPYEGEPLKKPEEELEETLNVTKRLVYSSDIDTNYHMNNAHYIRWIMDMFSTTELEKKRIVSIQIQYVKEVLEGNEIEVIRGQEAEGNVTIVGKGKDGTTHFISSVLVEAR